MARRRLLACEHCDLDLGDMTNGQTERRAFIPIFVCGGMIIDFTNATCSFTVLYKTHTKKLTLAIECILKLWTVWINSL